MARVSVLLTTYNAAAHVRDALASIAQQTYKDFEVIVADDGSTDGTAELVAASRDPRVNLITGPHMGLPRNWARAVPHCRGELIAVIAGDDRWLPNNLAVGVSALDRDPAAALAYGRVAYIDEQGEPIEPASTLKRWRPPSGTVDPYQLLYWNYIGGHTAVFRRNAMEAVGGIDSRFLLVDLDLFFRIAQAYPIMYTAQTTAEYRIHRSGMNRNRQRTLEAKLELYAEHLPPGAKRRELTAASRVRTAYTQLWPSPSRETVALARSNIFKAVRVRPTLLVHPLHMLMLASALAGPIYVFMVRRIYTAFVESRLKLPLQRILKFTKPRTRRSPMRLLYLSDAAIPSRSTNSMQTMRMCTAFASCGADVTLIYLHRRRDPPEGFGGDVGEFYGVPPTFERRELRGIPVGLIDGSGFVARLIRTLRLTLFLLPRALPGGQPTVYYGRSLLALSIASGLRRLFGGRSPVKAVVVEVHDLPTTWRAGRLLERADLVVPISRALRDDLAREWRIAPEALHVEHDGHDPAIAALRPNGAAGNGEEPGDFVVTYTGRAIRGKGVNVLIDAAARLEGAGVRFEIVGKVYEPEYRMQATSNVLFHGFVPPAQVPQYLARADALVMPTTTELSYARYTSPLKLFEYMAAGRPVIASDLPVIREVLRDGENAVLFPPGDGEALAGAIERLRDDRKLAARLAATGHDDVQRYSWSARVGRILARLELADDLIAKPERTEAL